jgi:alanyl-tRNA synthetase
MKTDELREKYLAFFESKGHSRRPSDVLVPHGDPSVLFTPAGMNQFKDHFLGKVKLDFTRATTCQKCLRTGDIDNVGRTAYHHTFFEMLGNFSFGDYFKRDAIHWAWEFLTSKEWLAIDPNRLTVSVYLDDDEAAGIWTQDIGLPSDRVVRMGEDDNFWPAGAPSQGPDGVCGPCSEIFYHDEKGSEVEIWNLVFTQFNRVGDPPDNLRPLPSKNIDTGMGLERIASVLQGVDTNFHIDVLRPIVEAAAEICGRNYVPDSDDGRRLRRITDHVRACTFAIHESVEPGTKKQSYVIRRLLRRAILDGHQMGLKGPFLYQLVEAVVNQMKVPYPDLPSTQSRVADEIQEEEKIFFGTIDEGVARIERVFEDMKSGQRMMVSGEEAADLYTTFGVPPELFQQLANERQFTFDWDGYRAAMEEHGQVSGGGRGELFKTGAIESIKSAIQHTEFVGYDEEHSEACIRGVVHDDKSCEEFDKTGTAEPVIVILDRSPFYGESGGQVGDAGRLVTDHMTFQVHDTQKNGDLLLHYGVLEQGTLRVGESVRAEVDHERRQGIRRAHSATHILHHALQTNLGEHAQQRGSKVEEDHLRFDFKNRSHVEFDMLEKIERDVIERIGEQAAIRWDYMPIDEARSEGAMMLFGEKYPDVVRMVSMGGFSKELCGGTHLTNTQEVGAFEIVAEEAVSAGTRRIVALTGGKAEEHQQQVAEAAQQVAALLGVSVNGIPAGIKALMQHVRELKKQLASGQVSELPAADTPVSGASDASDYPAVRASLRESARLLNAPLFDVAPRVNGMKEEVAQLEAEVAALAQAESVTAASLLESADQVAGVTVVLSQVPVGNANLMRQLIDQIRQQTDDSVVLLAGTDGDRCLLVCGVSKGAVSKIKAGDIVKAVAPVVGGGGGGRPEMAQAGGKEPAKIPDALAAAKAFVASTLTG